MQRQFDLIAEEYRKTTVAVANQPKGKTAGQLKKADKLKSNKGKVKTLGSKLRLKEKGKGKK